MGERHSGNENFPVASRLLPAWARPHVMAFYTFARVADDIADAPGGDATQKCAALEQLSHQLDQGVGEAGDPAFDLHQSLNETQVTTEYAQNLLRAFMRDAVQPTTDDWPDLMAYCALSAAPVGRYLIDLMGGVDGDDYRASDALCAALQILNHLQDVRDDYTNLGRIYVPSDWMAEAGVVPADLGRSASTPALRGVLMRMLDGVDGLLVEAEALPGAIRSKELAREAAGILMIAKRLSKALRNNDPLAKRVALSKLQAALWFLWGALTA